MSGMPQKIQYSLALEPVDQGETPVSGYQGTEPFVAKPTTESPAAELSPNLGDGLRDQAAAVWDCEDAGLAATSIPSVNLTP